MSFAGVRLCWVSFNQMLVVASRSLLGVAVAYRVTCTRNTRAISRTQSDLGIRSFTGRFVSSLAVTMIFH